MVKYLYYRGCFCFYNHAQQHRLAADSEACKKERGENRHKTNQAIIITASNWEVGSHGWLSFINLVTIEAFFIERSLCFGHLTRLYYSPGSDNSMSDSKCDEA